MHSLRGRLVFACLTSLLALSTASASDWPRFRGPNGSGISPDKTPAPIKWSPSQNVRFKVKLPGPGSSSPILVGDKVFVTCWSGYGENRNAPAGDQQKLLRHLVCLDRQSGKKLWDKTVAPYLPEDHYGGMFAEHGYASHTPVSDGQRVYVFFGKSGALAFDLEGKQLWQTSLGTGSGAMGWGSASSPILYKNLLIVTASAESEAMYALDKETGKQVWTAKAPGFRSTWGTPVLYEANPEQTDIVIGVPNEIWGMYPETGKLRWFAEVLPQRSFCSSVISDGKLIYGMGDEEAGSIALSAGPEKGAKPNVAWTGRERNRIGSPVIVDGKLYYVNGRVATSIDAKSGSRVTQVRLAASTTPKSNSTPEGSSTPGGSSTPSGPSTPSGSSTPAPPSDGFRGPSRGGFGGMGGRMVGQDYSSPVVADGKLYYVARNGDAFVLKLGDTFELLAANRMTDDSEDFSATPALCDGALFVRSNKHLYCVAEKP